MDLDIFLKNFYQLTHFPLMLYCNDKHLKTYSTVLFEPNPAFHSIKSVLSTKQTAGYTISPDFLFCGLVRIHDSDQYIVIGPVAEFTCNSKLSQQILHRLNEPVSRTNELMQWFKTIPLTSSSHFKDSVQFLNYILNGDESIQNILLEEDHDQHGLYEAYPNTIYVDHEDIITEKKILSCIQHGNVDELKNNLKQMESSRTTLANVANDAVRAFKNIFVVSATLASRSAIKGGLNHNLALSLSDSYLKRMELLNTYSQLRNFLNDMLIDFAEKTSKNRLIDTDSTLVIKIYNDVSSHIYEKNSVAAIAKRLGYNRSYLCRQFKLKTGKTISDYINEAKIAEAERLLQFTDFPLVQIAAQLDFSSQHYFHTIFKKIKGITPAKYRESLAR